MLNAALPERRTVVLDEGRFARETWRCIAIDAPRALRPYGEFRFDRAGQKTQLRAVGSFNETPHPIPRIAAGKHHLTRAFLHSQDPSSTLLRIQSQLPKWARLSAYLLAVAIKPAIWGSEHL